MPKRIPTFRPSHMVIDGPSGSTSSRDRKPAGRFHATAVWQKARAWYLKTHTRCERCKAKGRVVEATVVHHLIDVADRPDLALETANLEALCVQCHNSETARRRGEGGAFARASGR